MNLSILRLVFYVLSWALLVFNQLHAKETRPNILLVMVDDMGFSDLGCYGSEIETPNMDKLAAGGVRFTQFYNTAKCHSSRASLLSGRWCKQAGDESLKRAVTIPEVLKPVGYFTAMTGKWHLQQEPTDFGFDRYFGHLSGSTNYYRGDNTFRFNGKPWEVPKEGFYTRVANVDHGIDFLGEARAEEKPWFLYIAFNAPHAPLQPLEADYKKYSGRYDIGWDAIRDARVAKQKRIGILPPATKASPRPDHDRGTPNPTAEPFAPSTTWSDSTGWAWARNSPFRFYKQNQFEGGISTPAIMHWPKGLKAKPGSIVTSPAHLVDLLPTIAEIAGAKVPMTFPGRELTPLAGISLGPIIAAQEMKSRPAIHLLFASDRGLRDGDWKIVSYKSQPWELYNIALDRTELNDVAAKHPDIVNRMIKQWHEMSDNVLMLSAKENKPVDTQVTPKTNREWTDYDLPLRSAKLKVNRKASKAVDDSKSLPRARIGTKLRQENDQLVLTCSGDDPGLAFNDLSIDSAGPYTLTFRLQAHSRGEGEIYWTTDATTTLPKGKHLAFPVTHDGQWHEVTLKIDDAKTLHALRLDPCAGPGEVRIESLTLLDSAGNDLNILK